MELVTGKAGTPHVSSADDGRRLAGEVGTGSYVLQTGGRLAPSLVDANTVRFATGDVIVQGRHIGLTAPEDVKVASGTQGKKRTDYICVHYRRDVAGGNPTLVETCGWKVLQGTPGATATAPTVPAGSILNGDADVTVPIASVSFDGLTTGAPKLLVPTLTPLATLGDSVSQRLSGPKLLWSGWTDSGNITVPGSTEYSLFACRITKADDVLFGVRLGDSSVNFTANAAWGISSATQMAVVGVRFSTSGDKWTFAGGGRYNAGNGYSYGIGGVSYIYGIA